MSDAVCVVGWTTIVTVEVAPEAMSSGLAVTVMTLPVTDEDEVPLVVTETSVTLAGRTSTTETPVASLGPLLVMSNV